MFTIAWLLVWWFQGNPDFINPEMDASWVVTLILAGLCDLGSSTKAK